MSLWRIAWRSIEQRSLASTLTAISMALGVTLVVAVLLIHSAVEDSFRQNSALGYNMIVSAKGGKLQAVLNTVYYLSSPVENIPYPFYKQFTEGEYSPYVAEAVPVCLGDYYKDFRVIGTTPAMFGKLEHGGKPYRFASGRNFNQSGFFEAVIGATVAHDTGLGVGDEFQPSHGVPGGHKHDPFKIVGVLERTGTPNDRGLFINMEGFFLLEGHAKEEAAEKAAAEAHEGDAHKDDAHEKHEKEEHADHDEKHEADHKDEDHKDADHKDAEHAAEAAGAKGDPHAEHEDHDKDEHHAEGEHAEHEHAEHEHGDHEHGEHEHHHHHKPLPESQREVTAILVLMRSYAGAPAELLAPELVKKINKGVVGQAILPIREITNLFDIFVRPIQNVLLALTVLIVIVSGISILVSIYNSMSDRRHEIAVMRALGASRRSVMLIVLCESILLSLGGGIVGWLLGHGLSVALNPWIVERTGVAVGFFHFVPYESVIIPGLIALAALVGYLPAMAAYRTDVAKSLTATP